MGRGGEVFVNASLTILTVCTLTKNAPFIGPQGIIPMCAGV
jgi:hypothetical protein